MLQVHWHRPLSHPSNQNTHRHPPKLCKPCPDSLWVISGGYHRGDQGAAKLQRRDHLEKGAKRFLDDRMLPRARAAEGVLYGELATSIAA